MAENYIDAEQDYLQGMKYKDIAAKYGVTINTVKSWKQRYSWSRDKEKGAHLYLLGMGPKILCRIRSLPRNSRCFAFCTAVHSMQRRVIRRHIDVAMNRLCAQGQGC